MPLEEAAGRITGVVTVSLDITQQKEAQKLNTLLATAIEHAGDVIEITDAESRFEYVNAAFERISGYSRTEALGETPFSLLMSDPDDEPHYRAVQNAIASGQVWHGTLTGRRKNGARYEQEATISPVRDAEGVITHYVAVKRDITERLQTQARIWHLAHHDALTDLPNRVLFQDRLQQAVAQARRTGLLMAILFIDLDNFKDVNDALGHEFGDLLLKSVTQRLRGCTRETDTVARLGGDEFALIHTGLDRSEWAAKLAEKVLERLSEPFSLEGQEVHISASIGVTLCPLDHDDPQQIVKNADMAMYRAKNTGRANYQFYKEDMNLAFQARKALERDLRKALAHGQLDLFYQPQIDARRSLIIGAEALVRWRHPTRGMISPAEFVPIAEECGLIVPLGDWVLETACTQNRIWQDLGLPPVRVAVNLSAQQFLYRDLVGSVVGALETSGLDHACLELEITEGILMRETEMTISTLRRLTELGIQIAVDDFGTGYSSMAYLKRFPVNKIKIDRAFVTDVTTDPGDAAIVGAVIGLAHGLGLSVAAEGVETFDQAAHLRARGCDELQGYYFGRPMRAGSFQQRLAEMRGSQSTP
ncbi:MAG TPA: EAL domain-containing protein, partial [Burkholderiales bacterium]|nr:EAL domain-containing protein [Burkholderiales bacterium]